MNKNKKFQKEKLTEQGYNEYREYYAEEFKWFASYAVCINRYKVDKNSENHMIFRVFLKEI